MKIQNKGQVWIETVLYTIVGLAIIAVILAFMLPKINQAQDKIIIDQSIAALKTLDQKIQEVARQSGNVGQVEFQIKRGELTINPKTNQISMFIDNLDYLYSEEGISIRDGRVDILSLKGQSKNSVNLSINYSLDITYAGKDEIKRLSAASSSYAISIENINNVQMDIRGG